MNEWERHANASLRALADAYALGSIDRQAYRARRRRVLQALVAREDITQPAPTPADSPVSEDSVTLLLASRRGIPRTWWGLGLMAATAALVVVAIAYWMLEQGHG